ncbi:MAG: type II secretion system minor pseudopilin GspK [Legionella sp.]|uniref:type II secretion system minor pseudopilin GspK n=1 Tax=Legionella sp. TaxID=459 RepID=UPI0039E53EDD
MHSIKHKYRGGALLTALFIMTLVAIVATAMSSHLQVDIYRTRLIVNHDRLYYASQAVAFWAMSELNDPKKKFNMSNNEGVVGRLPKSMSHVYPSVILSGELYDLQSRFNLNNLLNRKSFLGFANLVSHVISDLNGPERINLAFAINNWISTYDLALGTDKYLSYYLKQKPPYHPSHQLMQSASELRLIKDVNSNTYLALQPYITALPETTSLNINTATPKTLLSLGTLDNDKVKQIIEARGEKGLKDLAKLEPLLKKLNIAYEQITLESTYFLSVAHATSDNQNFTVYTLLKRSRDKKGKLSVSILRESINVF